MKRRRLFLLLPLLFIAWIAMGQTAIRLLRPGAYVWPEIASFSSNNFLDHFPGSSLNTRWTSVTSGTGSVSVTDSYAECATGASGNDAFFYNGTKLDKTKSQLWTICIAPTTAAQGVQTFFTVINKSTAPVADTYANFNPNIRIFADIVGGTNSDEFRMDYYDTSHVQTRWNGSGSSWGATDPAFSPVRADDYSIMAFEIDGPNLKWRMLGWCKTYISGYTSEQGLRMFALTDWINWSSLQTTSDLWLLLGNPFTDNSPGGFRFEWVRYAENNAPVQAWSAVKQNLAGVHRLRHYYSHDGLLFVPEDRTTWALDLGGGSPDNTEVQEPSAIYDGANTDYLFYGGTSSSTHTICVAKATHKVPQNGPWTRGSNPILNVSGTAESQLSFPFILMDKTEGNTNKRWKMLYTALDSVSGRSTLYYATAPDPPDTSTWTRQGQILGLGGGGSADEIAARDGVVVRYNNQWEVWYEGWAVNGTVSIMRSTGTDLGSLTKDGGGPRISGQSGGTNTLTVNLTGRTVTVTSTSGFMSDGPIALVQAATGDDWSTSRVRKVTDSTHLELYHGLDGFTSSGNAARVRQLDAVKRFTLRNLVRVGSEWWFYMTTWGTFDDDATFSALLEQNTLYSHNSAAPSGVTPAFNQLASPVTSLGFNNDRGSLENMSLLMFPSQ